MLMDGSITYCIAVCGCQLASQMDIRLKAEMAMHDRKVMALWKKRMNRIISLLLASSDFCSLFWAFAHGSSDIISTNDFLVALHLIYSKEVVSLKMATPTSCGDTSLP